MSVLQTIDLKKYYGTEPNITRALDGVNFSVEDGEFVGIHNVKHDWFSDSAVPHNTRHIALHDIVFRTS